MAVAGKDELTRRKPPGNTRVMVGGKLSKGSQVNGHLLLAETAFSWSTWFIFGDALEFFCSFKFSQWKQNLLSSVGLKTPKGKWKKMWVCEIIIHAQLEISSVGYECKQHPNQRKAWEQNAVLVQTDTVYFLRAENGRTLGVCAGLCQDFLNSPGLGCYSWESLRSKPNLSRVCSVLYCWDSDPQICSFTHTISPRAFLQEHCAFCFDGSSLSVYLDRIRARGISVRHIAVQCKKWVLKILPNKVV